jgi:hypothetical protein
MEGDYSQGVNMNRLYRILLASGVLSLALLVETHGAPDEPAAPPVPGGNWKVLLPTFVNGGGLPSWLLQFEQKDGTWTGILLATGKSVDQPWPKVSVEKVTVTADKLRFTLKSTALTLSCEVQLVKGADKLRGETLFRGEYQPIELERTAITSLDRFDLLRDAYSRAQPGVETVMIAQELLKQAEKQKVKPAEARGWAEKAVKTAELYGPGFQRDTILNVADVLVGQKDFEKVGLPYAQKAERLLTGKESGADQKRVLDVLAVALEKTGSADEAKAIQARIKKLDFRVKARKYAGRKSKSDRVVLVQAFTNAGLKECIATDQALDALATTFKPSELLILNYHVNSPERDPLAGADSLGWAGFYEVKELPTVILNGAALKPIPGEASEAQSVYDDYVGVVENELERAADVTISVEAASKDGKVSIKAEASKLDGKSAEKNCRLRVALIEDGVEYKGGNGLAVHQNVVRAVPEPKGAEFKDKAAKLSATIDLDDLRKKHKEFMEKAAKEKAYPTKEQPLALKKLRVAAYVQDDGSNEILHAVVVPVKGE